MWTVMAVAGLAVSGCVGALLRGRARRRPRWVAPGRYQHRERRDGEPLGLRIDEAIRARRRPS